MKDQAFDPKELLTQAASRFDVFGREVRTIKTDPIEIREDDEGGKRLVGHAAVFNVETVIGRWFREQVAPGAFKKTIKEADVRHLFNHNPDYVLARTTNDTLELKEDDIGLAYDALLNPEDPDAIRVQAKVERGDVSQSSFGFVVIKDEWEEGSVDEKTGTRKLPLRTIKEARLFDTSTVTYPAYSDADAMIRMAGIDLLTRALGVDEESVPELLMTLADAEDEDAVRDNENLADIFRAIATRAAELAEERDADEEEAVTRADDSSPDDGGLPAADAPEETEGITVDIRTTLENLESVAEGLRDLVQGADDGEAREDEEVVEDETVEEDRDTDAVDRYVRFQDRQTEYFNNLVKE